MEKIETIYVRLLDEGIEVFRPVRAVCLQEKLYKIIDQNYDPETETWEFVPQAIVQVEFMKSDKNENFLAAVKSA